MFSFSLRTLGAAAVFALLTAGPAAAEDHNHGSTFAKAPLAAGCYNLAWKGGSAGSKIKITKSVLTVIERGKTLFFKYDWKNGEVSLTQKKDTGSKVIYEGTWKQDGSSGPAGLSYVPGKQHINGFWSGSDGKKNPMTVTKCGH